MATRIAHDPDAHRHAATGQVKIDTTKAGASCRASSWFTLARLRVAQDPLGPHGGSPI